jgi:hypothetical protein
MQDSVVEMRFKIHLFRRTGDVVGKWLLFSVWLLGKELAGAKGAIKG